MRVRLFRDSFDTPWGFRLQGGKDLKQPLVVQRVFSNTPAEGELQRGDIILSINSRDAAGLTHKQALDSIKFGGGQIELDIDRPALSSVKALNPSSPTRAPSNIPPVQQGSIQIPIRRKSDQTSVKPSMPPPVAGHTPTKITLNKYGGGTQSFGSSYAGKPPTPYTQHYAPQPNMMERVQDSLDSALSPPAYYQSPPQFQQPPPQQPQRPLGHSYQPMSPQVTSNQVNLQSQQPDYIRADDPLPEEDYEYVPVSKMKQKFAERTQSAPRIKSSGKTKQFRPVSNEYSSFGVDYSKAPQQPAPQPTSYRAPPAPPPQRPVNAAPEYDTTDVGQPAWSNTLRPSNVPKPWEMEQQDNIMPSQQQQNRPPPPVAAKPRQHQAPAQRPINVRSVPNGPPPGEANVVHLQYNSPIGLYSKDNIQETYTGQTQGSPYHTSSTSTNKSPSPQKSGDRDWSESYVYQMIHEQPKPKKAPAAAPKKPPAPPQQQGAPAMMNMYDNMEVYGSSDF